MLEYWKIGIMERIKKLRREKGYRVKELPVTSSQQQGNYIILKKYVF